MTLLEINFQTVRWHWFNASNVAKFNASNVAKLCNKQYLPKVKHAL